MDNLARVRISLIAKLRASLVVCTVIAMSVLCSAQGNLGGIAGHVADSTGASVPGAAVRITQTDTGTVTDVSSTSDGDFAANSLNPGTYQISVSKPGFSTAVENSVIVSTATVATVNLVLSVGRTTEVTTVNASEQQLNTENAEVGTVLPQKDILDLPISLGGNATIGASGRRQIENFTFLTPGVTGNQWSKNINGAPGFSQDILYDGGDAQSMGAPGFIAESSPPYEAVSEFKVQNTQFPAEYGYGFGIENFTFRSGTNQFHGDLFEFLRNDILDAKGYFATTKAPLRQNEFGGTIGGPVLLPHYNGRDRTFFFFAYDGFRLTGGLPATSTVTIPSLLERAGNFSDYPLPIYDPATTTQLPDGTYTRTAFPGNIIPAGRISVVAGKLLTLLPKPDSVGWNNNYLNRQNQPTTENSYSVRIDHTFNEKNRVSGTFWWTNGSTDVNGALSGNVLDQNRVTQTNGGGVRANYTRFLSQTLINTATFGFTPVTPTWSNWLADPKKGNSILQIPGISQTAPGFPTFNFTGTNYQALGNSTSQGATPQHFDNFSANDTVSWIRGVHQVRVGGNYRYRTMKAGDLRNSAGTLNFSNLSTSNPSDPSYGQFGNALASVLLGQVYSGSVTIPERTQNFADTIVAFYGEDTIKVSPKLTATLGVRYELPFYPSAGGGGDLSSVLLNLPNPAANGIPGALRFSGKEQGGSGTFNVLYKNYRSAVSPRIGIAYQAHTGTVVRAGYGIFYVYPNYGRLNAGSDWGNGYGYTQSVATTNQGISPAFNLDAGFPPSGVTLPNTDPSLLNSGSANYINVNSYKPAKQQSWTLDLQQNLPFRMTLDLAYVGAHTIRLEGGFENVDQVNPKYLSLGTLLNQSATSAQAVAAGIHVPYPSFTGSVAQALRPFPQYTTLNDVWQPTGNADYNALQVRFQKSSGNGLTFLTSYTFSKTHGLVPGDTFGDPGGAGGVGSLNTYNLQAEQSISQYDQTNVLVVSGTYELPIGTGKMFGSAMNPVLNEIVGGWQLNAIGSYSSGAPIGVSGGTPLPLFAGVGNRPNLLSQNVRTHHPINTPATDLYLNPSAFADPAPFTFGNAPRYLNFARNPTNYDEAFSAIKRFPIRERFNLEFRAEMFDVLNRVVFGGLDSNIDDPNFGHFTGQANTPRVIQGALKLIF